jgi:predicted DNA-binding transcriptional regulator AlpA
MNEDMGRPPQRCLTVSQIVPDLIPLSKTTLGRLVKRNAFPSPILGRGTRVRLWLESDVLEWIHGKWKPSSRSRP